MARILDALALAAAKPPSAEAVRSQPEILVPDDPAPEEADEIPFIEVGGGPMEASPSVLATRPLPARAGVPLRIAPSAPDPAAIVLRPLPLSGRGDVAERFAPELLAFHQPEHAVSRQYAAIATRLLGHAAGPQTLLLSGAGSATDVAAAVLNLAIAAAREGRQRVVVVDAAGQPSAVAGLVGLAESPGLQEVVTGVVALPRALQPSGLPNLHVLATGDAGRLPFLALRSLPGVFHQLQKRCDVVLVHGPAWDGSPEMAALGAACAAVYLVVPHEQAETPATDELIRSALRQGVPLGGCILART